MAEGSSTMEGGALLTHFLSWGLEAGPRASPKAESQGWFADTQRDACKWPSGWPAVQASLTCLYSSDFSHGPSRQHTDQEEFLPQAPEPSS